MNKSLSGTAISALTVAGPTRPAMGWSAKKMPMGNPVNNEACQKVGKVEGRIISPKSSEMALADARTSLYGGSEHI